MIAAEIRRQSVSKSELRQGSDIPLADLAERAAPSHWAEKPLDLLGTGLAAPNRPFLAAEKLLLGPRSSNDLRNSFAEFRNSLRSCLDDTFEDTDAAREARFKRIEDLISRLSEQITWRDRAIDVRRWFDFGACEVESETGQNRSYYQDSSGQSGGEKAKLAFTILVAAIAYQYDLDLSEFSRAGFRFVVVDEMFSKVDDRFAEYALKLFERFGLQLIIVAPLDPKVRITGPFVQYYLQILKDERTHRSQLVTMTAREYVENVVAHIEAPTRAKSPALRVAK